MSLSESGVSLTVEFVRGDEEEGGSVLAMRDGCLNVPERSSDDDEGTSWNLDELTVVMGAEYGVGTIGGSILCSCWSCCICKAMYAGCV